MGEVGCFHIEGIKCWFYSQDHRPPHFHAKRRGEWCFRVWFLEKQTAMLERRPGPKGRVSTEDRKILQRMATEHRDELLLEWERKVKHDD
jgi:hypothetical protein